MPRPPTNPPATGRGLADLVFMLAFGVGGWVLLAVAHGAGLGPHGPGIDLLPFSLFLAVVVAARLMAFELLPGTVVSADAAFFVAAAFCLGPLAAGTLVALALTVDSLLRLRRVGRSQRGAPRGRLRSVVYVAYFGGMTGALLFAAGWVFGAGAGDPTTSHVTLFGRVFGLGATLLVAHYAIQGARQVLAGRPLRVFLRRMALPGMLAEVSLLPLAVVVLLVYHPSELLGFALLAATYLLINLVFNRLGRARDVLRQRVSDLETLNATAGELSRSLQADELIESVARGTLGAIGEAEELQLTRFASEGGFAVHRYRRDQALVSARVDDPGLAVRWVLDEKQALAMPSVGEAAATVELPREGGGSWIGVPLTMYGSVEGVLSIDSSNRNAFGADQLRLLEAIAGQVAVALQNAHLYELAMVDGLTALFVRRYFDARIDEEIKRADRFGTAFSVVMMDIDNFKQLNDTHGHVVGDRVLRAIADVVRREMRGVDTAARYGGEEIAIILPRTEMIDAYNLAERIRVQIESLELAEAEGGAIRVTASSGIAAYPDCGAADAVELVRCADRALYRAKKTGKNRVELYWTDSDVSGVPSIRTV